MPVFLQRLLPQHLLSRLIGRLADSEVPTIKSLFINMFCLFHAVNLAEAEQARKQDYASFNDFFTRPLKPGARPISGRICSPVDGTITALGDMDGDTLIQSKGHTYSLQKLMAGESVSEFTRGSFVTIYLAPHNYHRVHVPQTAELHSARYVPGRLFSVDPGTANNLPDLFADNERLVCRFNSSSGPMAAVMVGAMLVSGIKPVWRGSAYAPRVGVATAMRRNFAQGDELGRFQMGSTVILLFSQRQQFLAKEGDPVKFGEALVA